MAPKFYRWLVSIMLLASVATILAVSMHSLDEIHYLKSFFPGHFSVQQAFYAAAIELIKLLIISVPVVLIAAICLHFLRTSASHCPLPTSRQTNTVP